MNQFLATMVMLMMLMWIACELAWGGGDPSSKDHNPPGGGF